MKNYMVLLALNFFITSGFTQTEYRNVKILAESETNRIFTDDLKTDLGITYPIFRVYNYEDASGEYFLALTERIYDYENSNPLNDSIKGFCIRKENVGYSTVWQMKDFILEENNAASAESSVWFWTKYYELKDFDKDGLIDPIMIYGTSGDNGFGDGRIKILVYYKNKKYGVRHQNGSLDFQRNTKVDADFYNLPIEIQNHVRTVMKTMTENNHAIFPYGYQENMDARKTYFDEN